MNLINFKQYKQFVAVNREIDFVHKFSRSQGKFELKLARQGGGNQVLFS